MKVKELTNDELATILSAMRITGISVSDLEKECLEEAAERLVNMLDAEMKAFKSGYEAGQRKEQE